MDNQLIANREQNVSFNKVECDILNKGLFVARKLTNKPNMSPNRFLKKIIISEAIAIIDKDDNCEE